MTGRVQCVGMQERITGPIRQCDKPETFFRVEPFDRRVVFRAKTRRRWPGLHGSRQVPWRRAIEGEIIIEAAAPGRASTSAVVHIQETVVLITKTVARIEPDLSGTSISGTLHRTLGGNNHDDAV
jgi:hypothetical protein